MQSNDRLYLVIQYLNIIKEQQRSLFRILELQNGNIYNIILSSLSRRNYLRNYPLVPNTRFVNTPIQSPPQIPTNIFNENSIFQSNNLSEIDISNATERFLYRDISTNTLRCPITMETFSPDDFILQIKHCKHIFKEDALKNWLRTHNTCPTCRHIIQSSSQNNISNLMGNITNAINTTLQDSSNNLMDLFSTREGDYQYSFSFPINRNTL